MRVTREQLIGHVQAWSSARVHSDARWLPTLIYHFTDLRNVVQILESGELLSRSEAIARELMTHDNASSAVIGNTPVSHQDFVRLYFRPRTPTQFNNEGIRPAALRGTLSAHCPVPVFLLFDLVETLSLPGVLFSNGNMAAKGVEYSDEAAFFDRMPFDLIYHDEPMDDARKAVTVHGGT